MSSAINMLNEVNRLKKINIIPTPSYINISQKFTKYEISGVRIIGDAGEGIIHSLGMLGKNINISENGNLVIYNGYENFPEVIKESVKKLFEKKFAKKQGYYLKKENGNTEIAAYEETGCMYGIMTLIQLFYENTLPESFEIKDSPDFLYRANKWLLWSETGIWSYDRGDGVEKYSERIIRKLDMCLKYKVNMIVFDGFGWKSERFDGYNELMRDMNREARKRKIHLISSGYAMGYGLIGHGKGIYYGKAHMNRKSYPNGEIYKCIGTYDLGNPPDVLTGREYGTCISNEGLMREKLEELTSYIRNTEPGAVYMHNMDADYILEPLWLARCSECRKRWPNDCLWTEDGAAGAFAYFIENLYKGIASVKTDKYDAKKDCVVFIVSPGYIYMNASDENYNKARNFWQKISELLPHADNLYIGFREHYFNLNSNELRYDLMRKGWKNCDFASVYFCGGDGFYSDRLFLNGGLFVRLMKSCSAVIIENGNANQEPMQIYNAEYMWNCENSAYYNIPDMPDNYKGFEQFYIDYLRTKTRPEEIYGEKGLLNVICEKLYGKEAAEDFRNLFSICGENMEPPLISPCSCEIYTNFSKAVFPMRWDNEALKEEGKGQTVNSILEKFIQIDYATKQAKNLSEKIFREKKYLPEIEEDIEWMTENFRVCERFTDMLVRYMKCYKEANSYFEKGIEISEDTVAILQGLKKEADEFLAEINNMELKAIDVLGGAIIRRDEISDFLSYNSELMHRSIKEDKRIPDDLRQLSIVEHW